MEVPRGTLLSKSQPFAYALDDFYRGFRCDFCLRGNENLHRCSQCRCLYYCDKICQKKGWKDHKHECCNIKKVSPWQPCCTVLLISRVIYKLMLHNDSGEKIGDEVRYFVDLESHCKDIMNDIPGMSRFSLIQAKLKLFLPSEVLPSFLKLLIITGKININGFIITDDMKQKIGTGLYLGPSIFDHSCQPNATAVFEGPTMFVYAIESIPSLDYSKIYVSYTNLLATTKERRNELQRTYYFHCMCERCKNVEADNEWRAIKCVTANCDNPVIVTDGSAVCTSCGIVSVSEKILESTAAATELCSRSFKELEQELESKQLDVAVQSAENILQSASLFLHPSNVHYVRIAKLALDANVRLGNVSRVAELTKIVLPTFRKCYGPYNPYIGVLLLNIGVLELRSKRLIDAKEKLREAARIINITHGENHPLRATCSELLAKLGLSQ